MFIMTTNPDDGLTKGFCCPLLVAQTGADSKEIVEGRREEKDEGNPNRELKPLIFANDR
jgi:hypothetical protein